MCSVLTVFRNLKFNGFQEFKIYTRGRLKITSRNKPWTKRDIICECPFKQQLAEMAIEQQQDNFAEDVIIGDLQQCVRDKIKKCKKKAKSAIRLHDKHEKAGRLVNFEDINRRLDSLKSTRIKLMVLDDNWSSWPGSFHRDITDLIEREKKLEMKIEEIHRGQQEFGSAHEGMHINDEQDVNEDFTNDDLIDMDTADDQYDPKCNGRFPYSNEESSRLIHAQKIQIQRLKIELTYAREENRKLKVLMEHKGIKIDDSSQQQAQIVPIS